MYWELNVPQFGELSRIASLNKCLVHVCSAILFPLVVTVYVTWWFLAFFDNFFSPLYEYLLGFHVFGLGFVTSMLFIFATGTFLSSNPLSVQSTDNTMSEIVPQ